MIDKNGRVIDKHGRVISERWLAEFAGYFYGEGYLGITTNGMARDGIHRNYTARAQITARMDDLALIQEIHDKLGGTIHYEGRGPCICWAGSIYAMTDQPHKKTLLATQLQQALEAHNDSDQPRFDCFETTCADPGCNEEIMVIKFYDLIKKEWWTKTWHVSEIKRYRNLKDFAGFVVQQLWSCYNPNESGEE